MVTGVKLGEALERSKKAFPPEFQEAGFCDKWMVRLEAAARTWQRPYAQDSLM